MMLLKSMQCARCQKITTVKLVRDITAAGVSNVYWLCHVCHQNAGGVAKWIPHKSIIEFGIKIDDLPVEKDGRVEKCAVCGVLGAEWHHFAPRYLFQEEADKWPGAYLCHPHHEHWHHTVTPMMTANRREK